MTQATELVKKNSNAIVRGVDTQEDRVILSLATPLRNGQWENFPKNYSVWAKGTPDLYEKSQKLHEEHEIWLRWTEKPAPKGVYRDVIEMGRPKEADFLDAEEAPQPPASAPQKPQGTQEARQPFGGTPDPRADGMAYGAAQHAASRVLAAWVIKNGTWPMPAQVEALVKTLSEMTDEVFKHRLPGV